MFSTEIWNLEGYKGMMLEPFIKNTEFESGKIGNCFVLVLKLIQQMELKLDLKNELIKVLKDAYEFSILELDSGKSFYDKMIVVLLEKLKSIKVNEVFMVPGGYKGKSKSEDLIYIVERVGQDNFRFIVCNRNDNEYHANKQYKHKIKQQPLYIVENIKMEKMLDLSFWTLLLHININDSEYHQVSVIYQVLLPWLSNDDVSSSVLLNENMFWRTTLRANTGFIKNIIEGIRYICYKRGMNELEIKKGLYTLRKMQIDQTKMDLDLIYHSMICTSAIQKYQDHSILEKCIGVYLSTNDAQLSQIIDYSKKVPNMQMVYVSNSDEPGIDVENWIVLKTDTKINQCGFHVFHPYLKTFTRDLQLYKKDPNGEKFPYEQTERPAIATSLSDQDAHCINYALKQMAKCTLKGTKMGIVPTETINQLKHQVQDIQQKIKDIGVLENSRITKKNNTQQPISTSCINNFGLLNEQLPFDTHHAGQMVERPNTTFADILAIPKFAKDTLLGAISALVRSRAVCEAMMKRTVDGSSFSSKHAITHQVIQCISNLFLTTLPIPNLSGNCVWQDTKKWNRKLQLQCLETLYQFMMLFARLWQSIERSDRSFRAERILTSLAIQTIFEVVLRQKVENEPLVTAMVLEKYKLSYKICKHQIPIMYFAQTLELVQPQWMETRNDLLLYLRDYEQLRKSEILHWYTPDDKVEIELDAHCSLFFRELVAEHGYALIPPNLPNPPSEFEALMDWIFSDDSSKLLMDHPEVCWLRDITFIYKYMATVETMEQELVHKRIAPPSSMYGDTTGLQSYQWNLNFEEGMPSRSQMSFLSGTQDMSFLYHGVAWEVAHFRGADKDICDLQVKAWNDRVLTLHNVQVSPSNPLLYLPSSTAVELTEDDIMHAEKLPTFDGTISIEESESLMSFLTVPYARIPLLISFFSTQDRVLYLFHSEIQELFTAALFEGATWNNSAETLISEIPVQRGSESVLSTKYGPLLNELQYSPDSVLTGVLRMLHSVQEMEESIVYSADASYILFMLTFGLDVERYIVHAMKFNSSLKKFHQQFQEFFHGFGIKLLQKWLKSAASDIKTCCVVHTYIALLFSNTDFSTLCEDKMLILIGSMTYVRNWHGFGQELRPNLDVSLNSKDRLCRWLQAHGIDTTKLTDESIQRYIDQAKRRPLYLSVRGKGTVQAPNLASTASVLPPAEVPENRYFALLHAKRQQIVSWFDCKQQVATLLDGIVRVAMNDDSYVSQDSWVSDGAGLGRFHVVGHSSVRVDLQSCEVLWRDESLKPIPDSMVQYGDYHTVFGKDSFHCSIVSQQANRLWVNVVGTDYELMEWNELHPESAFIGIGQPSKIEVEKSSPQMYWQCPACTSPNLNGDQPNPTCEVCQTARDAEGSLEAPPAGHQFDGAIYDRIYDPYGNVELGEEQWIHNLLSPIIKILFSEQTAKLPYELYMSQSVCAGNIATIVGEEVPKKRDDNYSMYRRTTKKEDLATFHEFQLNRNFGTVNVFNIVSYGRRMYRKLIFTSNVNFCLHSLQPSAIDPEKNGIYGPLALSGGDLKEKCVQEASLMIVRRKSAKIAETYLPPRLLQGVVPSVLLESYQFWQGSDTVIRATPVEKLSQWFAKSLEIRLNGAETIITRVDNLSTPSEGGFVTALPVNHVSEQLVASEQDILELVNLGFSPSLCKKALENSNFDKDRAAHWLFNENNVQGDTSPLPGYSVEVASYAMNIFSNNQVLATEWLRDPQNAQEIARIESDEQVIVPSNESIKLDDVDIATETDISNDSMLYLLDLMTLQEGSPLFDLLKILAKLEDFSHILIWMTSKKPSLNSIVVIELPRLRIRFQPQTDGDSIYFHLVDQVGWFINHRFPKLNEEKVVSPLLALEQKLPFAVVLATNNFEYRILCTNHDIYRLPVAGTTFRPQILANRGSMGWQQTMMESRTFTYPCHASLQFISPTTLGGTIYLVLLYFSQHLFIDAFELLSASFTVDTGFMDEELWLFGQLGRFNYYRHPNAIACRLKATLSMLYSSNLAKCPWDFGMEMHSYLQVVQHVSSSCRITREEELDLLAKCTKVTSLVKHRRLYLECNENQFQANAPGCVKIGGLHWNSLSRMKSTHDNTVSITRVQYKAVNDSKIVSNEDFIDQILWKFQLISDDFNGTSQQLGFLFLYELVGAKSYQVFLADQNCTKSFGELLTRYVHLKMIRWGKQMTKVSSSSLLHREMIQLSLCVKSNHAALPKLPEMTRIKRRLELGIPLYSTKEPLEPEIKLVFQELQAFTQACIVENSSPSTMAKHKQEREKVVELVSTLSLSNEMTKSTEKQEEEMEKLARPIHASDHLCGSRTVPDHLAKIAHYPLHAFVEYVACERNEIRVDSNIPFDLRQHPTAKSPVAEELLSRLEGDLKNYATSENSIENAHFHLLTPMLVDKSSAKDCISSLTILKELLLKHRSKDYARMLELMDTIQNSVNKIANGNGQFDEFMLEKSVCIQSWTTVNQLVSCYLSTNFHDELFKFSPSLSMEEKETLTNLIFELLLCTNQMGHVNRCLVQIEQLLRLLNLKNVKSSILHASKELGALLSSKRTYMKTNAFDPRYLVFEYLFDIMLRPRQIEMVEDFLAGDTSRVQQMIMGAGKTTVVGPLLTLMLTTGAELVMHVMPSVLLEQSRQILRQRFQTIITKRIYTFSYDRNTEESDDHIEMLYLKLLRATSHGNVVCSSPESIKSLFLKFIELHHSIEQDFDITSITDDTRDRQRKECLALRESMEAKTKLRSGILRILKLWQTGVLIMDEVDVLLHPLRSELNFPIGTKYPIDMAGIRWDLPIHLLEVFFASDLCPKLQEAIQQGYAVHALQKQPHLILLDLQYYTQVLKPLLARWLLEYLHPLLVAVSISDDEIISYLMGNKQIKTEDLLSNSIKILNLARDWLQSYLPHILSKINRVSFGLLDLSGSTPPSTRRDLAVPFIGKDVPSRSSEFAHPDILIGLSVLSYRYEGLRLQDVKRLILQLKQDFSRQVGPRKERPSCELFQAWVCNAENIMPLPLFQPGDQKQLMNLHKHITYNADTIYYFLRQLVFPSCMNFQKLKLSACGHELGSSILFQKRIGFSGTPSNVLPMDLGVCHYEPQSDGKIFKVLTDPSIVSLSLKSTWNAKSLLSDIATSKNPSFNALIDTGALITGMDNVQVATYLLERLPMSIEGVVYLDKSDRQMIFLRESWKSMALIQCGIPPKNRFTFYDQVHTTGMDIKQSLHACAAITIGKDMTFRDYAQGAYRMRGIGKGQNLQCIVIPEVRNRIECELANETSPMIELVPAWLLLNSMRLESMQMIQMSFQELANVFRKEALKLLQSKSGHAYSANEQKSIQIFREIVSYDVESTVTLQTGLEAKVASIVEANAMFLQSATNKERVSAIKQKIKYLASYKELHDTQVDLNAEVVHENEIEVEEEAEEEAEEEEQKMSAYTRDDEEPLPWSVQFLSVLFGQSKDTAFYAMNQFTVNEVCPKIAFPENMLMSDNFFRPRWIGLGPRRLKNINFLLEWIPQAGAKDLQMALKRIYTELKQQGIQDDAKAAALAMEAAIDIQSKSNSTNKNADDNARYVVAISLSEGETLRRMIHTKHPIFAVAGIALKTVSGSVLDASCHFNSCENVDIGIQCFRFFNNDMYYTKPEITNVLDGLSNVPLSSRLEFFTHCQAVRRRERHLWNDTPLAKVFTDSSEWHLLQVRAIQQQFIDAVSKRDHELQRVYDACFAGMDDQECEYDKLLKNLQSLRFGFSAADLTALIRFMDNSNTGTISTSEFSTTLQYDHTKATNMEGVQTAVQDTWNCPSCQLLNPNEMKYCYSCAEENPFQESEQASYWTCHNCTFENPSSEKCCSVCEYNWAGIRQVPKGKWKCPEELGGCTFYNTNDQFYCQVCNRSKPNLLSGGF